MVVGVGVVSAAGVFVGARVVSGAGVFVGARVVSDAGVVVAAGTGARIAVAPFWNVTVAHDVL